MGNPVSFFQIQGGDAKGLTAFYKKVFGWKMAPARDTGGMMMVAAEAGGIAGGIGASLDGNKSVSVYVSVTDLERNLARIKAAGGQPAMDPFELPGGMGRIAGFIDPVGNWIGLWDPGDAMTRGAPKSGHASKLKGASKSKSTSKSKGASKLKGALKSTSASKSKSASRAKGKVQPSAPGPKPTSKKSTVKGRASKKSPRPARK
jgi:predicted enzyme related to lactoylglutathione lyase